MDRGRGIGALWCSDAGRAVGDIPGDGRDLRLHSRGVGAAPAFLFGWAELILIRAAALGAISTTFAEYLMRALGYDPHVAPYSSWVHGIAAAAIALTSALNYRGVRLGTLLQNGTTLIKCAGLLGLITLAFVVRAPQSGVQYATSVGHAGPVGVIPFGAALVSVLWVYDGWADVSFMAGEVRDPVRNLPRVLVIGNVCGHRDLRPREPGVYERLTGRDDPTLQARRGRCGGAAHRSRSASWPSGVIVVISTFGTLNGSMLTGPRVLWAVANDGLLFKRLAGVHPRYQTPHVAIVVAALLGIVFVSLRTFEQLADTFVIAILPFYALGVAAIFPLRRRGSRTTHISHARLPGDASALHHRDAAFVD